MAARSKGYEYDRAEVTFSREDEFEQELYKYLLEMSKVVGKGNYLKQLLYEDKIRKEAK